MEQEENFHQFIKEHGIVYKAAKIKSQDWRKIVK